MNRPKPYKRGDPFSAKRMNDLVREAKSSREIRASGPGLNNEAMGNQVFNEQFSRMRLVVAVDDFEIPEHPTDFYDKIDKVPSAKCLMLRLTPEADYKEETRSVPFRVWDPIAKVGGGTQKSAGDVFWCTFNPDTKRWEVVSSAGGGSHEILFYIVGVYCPDTYSDPCDAMYVEVQWTHYTGSCGSNPPGIDEYTGLIKVYDRGIFEYYTADQLVNGSHVDDCGEIGQGMAGRATYWYPKTEGYGECTPKWIVDSIIGNPECNDETVEDVGVTPDPEGDPP